MMFQENAEDAAATAETAYMRELQLQIAEADAQIAAAEAEIAAEEARERVQNVTAYPITPQDVFAHSLRIPSSWDIGAEGHDRNITPKLTFGAIMQREPGRGRGGTGRATGRGRGRGRGRTRTRD